MNILQEHFQKKCEAAFRRIMHTNKERARLHDPALTGAALSGSFSHVLSGSPRGGKRASIICDGPPIRPLDRQMVEEESGFRIQIL
ncbi:hypothetical protein CN884_19740 [Ochrobactrum sp. 30A/1000/2015]|nr:hypothetical protein O206_16130 [Ochrobactrum sp. EGD-AQ16]OAB82777.1 hypothetical protein A4G21_13095 [Brucella intermedia]PJT19973.1 hypothetical protein CN884_19740 [Ochrobactrum sp. 30A/1000/2015]PJT40167.1 hypothetical protein CN883_01250 [Ochrobactrum sp. 27A/999/2015]PJT45351.1 hypothetical protein CN882_06065 [Ochrobactrum sp. 23A/997/2015]